MNDQPESFSIITQETIAEANLRHDREHGHPYDYNEERIRSSWNEARLMRRSALTDKKINQYQEKGYYSAEYRQARKDLMDKKARRQQIRDGNWIKSGDRWVYQPV